VGNAISSPALVMSAAFWFGGPSSAALAVHEGAEHASVSPIRTKPSPCFAQNESWARQDSNLGPRDYESPALTAELQAHLPITSEGALESGYSIKSGRHCNDQ
jgi:hypothetical protein